VAFTAVHHDQGADVHVDAATFQKPLRQLAEVLAQKIKREAPSIMRAPSFVAVDLHVMIRQTMYTYDLLFYLNADERRESDCYWKNEYGVVVLPLVRNMIDSLYNITTILQDPPVNGVWFRLSGFKKTLQAFDEDEVRYGGQSEWDDWIAKGRDGLDLQIRANGIKKADVLAAKPWPTLGQYIRSEQLGGGFSEHQGFLRTFTYGHWREYSAIAHGGFEGLLKVGMYFIADSMPHEDRPQIEESYPRLLSAHIARAALMLLCIITELQAHFHFDGASINERIHKMWNALMPSFDVKELYDQRYVQLMKDKGINP